MTKLFAAIGGAGLALAACATSGPSLRGFLDPATELGLSPAGVTIRELVEERRCRNPRLSYWEPGPPGIRVSCRGDYFVRPDGELRLIVTSG
jgi:hypothetical protein